MTAVKRNLYIEQGATFVLHFQWCATTEVDGEQVPGDPHDLTGWKARMQLRVRPGSDVLVDATTENERIVLGAVYDDPAADPDPTNGRIEIRLSDEDTQALTVKKAKVRPRGRGPVRPGLPPPAGRRRDRPEHHRRRARGAVMLVFPEVEEVQFLEEELGALVFQEQRTSVQTGDEADFLLLTTEGTSAKEVQKRPRQRSSQAPTRRALSLPPRWHTPCSTRAGRQQP